MPTLKFMVEAGYTWEQIVKELGGTIQYIPKHINRPEELERRNKQIKERYRQLRMTGIDSEKCKDMIMAEFSVCLSIVEHAI